MAVRGIVPESGSGRYLFNLGKTLTRVFYAHSAVKIVYLRLDLFQFYLVLINNYHKKSFPYKLNI